MAARADAVTLPRVPALLELLPTLPLLAGGGGAEVGLTFTAIVCLGVGAQWLAWRLRVPSILLLLAFGFLVGPIAYWASTAIFGYESPRFLNVDLVLDEGVLLTLVSLSVGLILFEGGLSLNFGEIRGVRPAVLSLVTVGAVVTWVLASLAARFILDLPWPVATVLGGILVVTGPTVIGPLLRFVRPTGSVGKILKWEGIVIDPIGALLAVLVFEAVLAGNRPTEVGTFWAFAWGGLKAAVGGTAAGLASAWLFATLLRRFLVPDHLQIPVALGLAVLAFTLSNLVAPEAGLFATTVMGIALANQKKVGVSHILEFKETLVVLLIAVLFVVLSARLRLEDLEQINWFRALGFVAVLILLVRPLAVFASTAGKLGGAVQTRDKLFLSWMAPRGIVAAAIASVFGLQLQQNGVAGAELLVPYVFLVIVVTVAVYGLTCVWVARRLELANPENAGFLIAGATPLAREIGKALQQAKVEVLLVDINYGNVQRARLDGLPATVSNILSPQVHEQIELTGIGRLLALTPNDEVNSLATVQYGRHFGRSNVFQIVGQGDRKKARAAEKGDASEKREDITSEVRGRAAFAGAPSLERLDDLLEAGATISQTKLTREFGFDAWREHNAVDDGKAVLLFLVGDDGAVRVASPDRDEQPKAGQSIISLSLPAVKQATADVTPPVEDETPDPDPTPPVSSVPLPA